MNTISALQTIQPELLAISIDQMRALIPHLSIFLGAILTIFVGLTGWLGGKWSVFFVSITAVMIAIVGSISAIASGNSYSLFNDMLSMDSYSYFFNVIFLVTAIVTILVSFRYLEKEELQHPEYYVLILFSTLGMMLMTSALDLIVLFISLEIMSLCVYVLVGFRRTDRRSNEAALKYFVLGGVASAVLLYGTALIFGATGSLNIKQIMSVVQTHAQAQQAMPLIFIVGLLMVIISFLFKVAAVPFQMWLPDVYEGAPSPVTGFMAAGIKAAAFATFTRIFISSGYGAGLAQTVQQNIHHVLWILAALTMVTGNVVALTQTNLKRMLAYSAIAHSGYILVGFLSGATSEQGYAPIPIYLIAYALMNLGAFAVISLISSKADIGTNLHDFSGLSRKHPWMAFSMAVFLFSLAGLPPTAGFISKYLLFYSAIQAGELWLVVIGVLCSAISVYYYLRVLVYMYMHEPVENVKTAKTSMWAAIALATMVILTIQIGVLPTKVVMIAKKIMTTL